MSEKPKRRASLPSEPRDTRVREVDRGGLETARDDRTRWGDAIRTALAEVLEEQLEPLERDQKDLSPAFLYVEQGPGRGQLLEIKRGPVEIGRASTANLRIRHPSVSRRHVEIRRVGERFFLKDLGSQNGTRVNGVPVASEVELKLMASIALCGAIIRLRSDKPLQVRELRGPPRSHTGLVAKPAPPPRPRSALGTAVMGGAVGFAMAWIVSLGLSHPRAAVHAVPLTAAVVPDAPVVVPDAPVVVPDAPVLVPDAQIVADAQIVSDAQVVAVAPVSTAASASEDSLQPKADAPLPSRPEVALQPPTQRRAKRASRSAILSAYERGNAEASLKAAKQAGDQELALKLVGFMEASRSGRRAQQAHDVESAIASFERALAFDERISTGGGKYRGDLRRQLAGLQIIDGKQREAQGDTDAAQKAYEGALANDPTSAVATAALEKLKKRSGKSPDDAFNEALAPQAEAKKSAKRAIDDAFGE